MKNISLKLFLLLFPIFIGCQKEKLDTVDGENGANYPNVAYMNSESVRTEMTDEGGEAVIEPRLASIAKEDTKVTISVLDFFKAYNELNNTQYELLPIKEYELYEKSNPSNTSRDGKLTVTIPKGGYSSKVGVKINALDPEAYSFGIKYAIPFRVTSTSAKGILSNKDAVVTFDRPFKTDIMKVKRGYGFRVNFNESFPETTEFTIQAQYMFLDWASANQTTINGFGDYTRVSEEGGIQVKDGGGDGAATWTQTPLETGKWYQVTFAYKGLELKVYINGKLVKTFDRKYDGLKPGGGITIFNTHRSWTANQYIREIRVWSRELTEKEVNDDLYLPVNPKADGLAVYLPLDGKNKLNEITGNANVVFRGISDENDATLFENDAIEWTRNVKFPAEKLEIVE